MLPVLFWMDTIHSFIQFSLSCKALVQEYKQLIIFVSRIFKEMKKWNVQYISVCSDHSDVPFAMEMSI